MTFKKKVNESEKEVMIGATETVVAEARKDSDIIRNPLADKLTETRVVKDEYTANIVYDYDGVVDLFYLNEQDRNFEYRFLRADEKNLSIKTSNALFDRGGWQICPKEHLLRIGMKESSLSPDGMCRRGDTVLAFMPKDIHKKKEEYKRKKANEPMGALKRLLKDGDKTVGSSIHRSLRGIQHAEDLGMGKRDLTEM